MRHLAITGMVTTFWMPSIIDGSLMRETPPSRRMSEGTRSRAITADAPASSATLACSGVTTSMMTPPRSISASPRFTRAVPVVRSSVMRPSLPTRPTGTGAVFARAHRPGLRRCGHRVRDVGELDPRLAGSELDDRSVVVAEHRGLGLVGPGPGALDLVATREHDRVPGA